MIIEIKVLGSGNRWTHMDADDLVGQNLLDFVSTHPRPVVAAVMEGGNAVFFVCNKEEYVEMMLKKGPAVHISVLALMATPDPILDQVVGVFPGSKILKFVHTEAELLDTKGERH